MATHPSAVGVEVARRRMTGTGRWVFIGLVVALALVAVSAIGTYNRLVTLDQAVRAQWGQVENVYQRRSDLVPNLVQTVKGAAAFERETFTAVTEARARVGQVADSAAREAVDDPRAFQRFQEAQEGLSSALSRLLVVVERYPELRATQAFRDLQSQLEGTENRIAVERMRFNDAAREFNSARSRFPAVLVANLFGGRFREKPYFEARPGATTPPEVRF